MTEQRKATEQMLSFAVKGEGGAHSMTIADSRQFWEKVKEFNRANGGKVEELLAHDRQNPKKPKPKKGEGVRAKKTLTTSHSAKGVRRGRK